LVAFLKDFEVSGEACLVDHSAVQFLVESLPEKDVVVDSV
jgi:hypothetical protein